ncbi:MAG: exodeoxyribonuclease VII large subunit [Bilophila wadsworthia]
MESGFPYVWVRGEVTNVSRPSSGHIYFSLKDENALLQAVWFKGSQKERETFDPLTGEVFEDGPRMSLARPEKRPAGHLRGRYRIRSRIAWSNSRRTAAKGSSIWRWKPSSASWRRKAISASNANAPSPNTRTASP